MRDRKEEAQADISAAVLFVSVSDAFSQSLHHPVVPVVGKPHISMGFSQSKCYTFAHISNLLHIFKSLSFIEKADFYLLTF